MKAEIPRRIPGALRPNIRESPISETIAKIKRLEFMLSPSLKMFWIHMKSVDFQALNL
jgi:hypothetical protein